MTAEGTADRADEARAGHRFGAESRHSTASRWRWVRSFLGNVASSVIAGPATWPPVDIVVVELSTGSVVRRWHDGGEEAAGLLRGLNDDLLTLSPDEFIEKWDLPADL